MYFWNIIFGITQFTLIGRILIMEVNKKSPAVFLWGTLFIMMGMPHLVTVFLQDLPYSEETITRASVFVCAFCLLYIFIRKKSPCDFVTVDRNKHSIISSSNIEKSLFEYICFVVFLFSIVYYAISLVKAQGGLLNASWEGAREIDQGYVNINGLLIRIVFTFSGFSFYFFYTGRKIKSLIVLLAFVALVFITRNRVQLLPVLIFISSLFLVSIKGIRVKHIIIGAFIVVVFIYIIYAIRAFRYLGTLSNAKENFSWEYINKTVLEFIHNKNGELGLRQFFYYFIENDNNFIGFNRGYTYIRMLLVFIPSRWTFGIKPESFDLYMGQAIGMAEGGSMHPTLFGDCFGNMYWFGILLGAFWAVFANMIDKLIGVQKHDFYKIMIYFLASYAFVVIGRGSVYNGFQILAWGVLILFIMKKMLAFSTHIYVTFIRKNKIKRIVDSNYLL